MMVKDYYCDLCGDSLKGKSRNGIRFTNGALMTVQGFNHVCDTCFNVHLATLMQEMSDAIDKVAKEFGEDIEP